MKKSFFLIVGLIFEQSSMLSIEWLNGKQVNFKDWLSCNQCVLLPYSAWNSGDKSASKRYCGIHNMSVEIGETKIDLIKDDVCLYPHLFTRLAYVMNPDNAVVQRWSCVLDNSRWMIFDMQDHNTLTIKTACCCYKIAPFLTEIGQQKFQEKGIELDLPIVLKINERSISVAHNQIVHFCNVAHLRKGSSTSSLSNSSKN